MSSLQTPYTYIKEHYEHTVRVDEKFPVVAKFVWSSFRHITGDAVLNVGCGSTFYDYLAHFGETPSEYLGIDINENSFDYMRDSNHPRLMQAKADAEDKNVKVDLLSADVFDIASQLKDRFNAILSVGFLATFNGERLRELLGVLHGALKTRGVLVKVTWHGPYRTPKQTSDKLKYGFDNSDEISPAELLTAIEHAGFRVRHNQVLACDPRTYRWDAIQACVFERA